jgi:transposase
LGNPLRLAVTAGQTADLQEAIPLVEGFTFERLIADRGYAAQAFYDWVVAQEMEPVIPPHQRAKGQLAERPYDYWHILWLVLGLARLSLMHQQLGQARAVARAASTLQQEHWQEWYRSLPTY